MNAIVARGRNLSEMSKTSRSEIAQHALSFIGDEKTILIHGYSRVVLAALAHAADNGKRFSVMVTESRPDCAGYRTVDELTKIGVPCTLICDSAVARFMEDIDLVLFGAEAVMESGGIVNKIGTLQLAMVAKLLKKPVYVAAESYKFSQNYPLRQVRRCFVVLCCLTVFDSFARSLSLFCRNAEGPQLKHRATVICIIESRSS